MTYKGHYRIGLFSDPTKKSICEATAYQVSKLVSKWRFCLFDPHLALMLALFVQINGKINQVWIIKHIFYIHAVAYELQ